MGAIKTYEITVQGFPKALYCARTPAKARAQCWRAYAEIYQTSFKDFLQTSTIRRVANPPAVGDRVMIAGRPATRVLSGAGRYVAYMRDDSDIIFYANPADVQPLHFDGRSS